MPSFERVLAKEPKRKAIVASAIATLKASGGDFTDVGLVLGEETRLKVGFWSQFADQLGPSGASDASTIFSTLSDVGKAWGRKGPKLKDPPRVYGRLLEIQKAIAVVRETGLDHAAAEKWLWDLTRTNLKSVKRVAGWLPLGRYTIWSTFCATRPPDDDPFAPLAEIAMLPIDLGLEFDARARRRKKYLMLAFELPSGVQPRSPTIADAYAGGTPNARFRPYGLTHATVIGQEGSRPRPECVHDVVTLDSLTAVPGGIPHPGWPR